ncbi:MAG: valine--tRNA ligase [Candidatus Puniceispirillaceae bacterium]
MLNKTYTPQDIETKWYEASEKAGAFACDPASDKQPYTIMMPPPNVTGSLHMGHALTFTLQDILIRYHRMAGRDSLWQPGMDHAGIATQMVVERQLGEKNISRRDLGRDAFVEKVWEWKAESGGMIEHQQRHLGVSADWERSRFTMDQGLSDAVRKVFVKLHKDGLIYRDKRLVNWDPKLLTAISDLEVEQKETTGKMWQIHYPVTGEEGRFITAATTRPETMFGDMAVAVHPDDERYADLVGKTVTLPIVGREIPIIADSYSDPEKGTGAVKITPAHDFNDFEVGKRHQLEMLNIFDQHAAINENGPDAYQGMDRFDARKKLLAELEEMGALGNIEDNEMSVPHGDRSGVPVEPWLMDQWYVDAAQLAIPAIKAVEDGQTRFVPERWSKTYFEWMRNIQPWCVSRQLWWGHRIPAWYGPDGTPFVEMDEDAAQQAADAHYGKSVQLTQDEDVLDTWFSSALWPFSTIGWPEDTAELKRYYPGEVLVTGFDIIFFWVARMMMMSMYIMDGEVPFKDVYIHALVRDEKGQKMSKSKGNVLDPLDLTKDYGADALRFTLCAMAAQGRDLKLSIARVESYRNFATKIWNAARFLEFNELSGTSYPDFDLQSVKLPVNQWIVSKLNDANQNVAKAIEAYRFNEAADHIYHFIWNSYCDWYLEYIKPVLKESEETRKTATEVLRRALHILHPMMPFLTEELNEKIFGSSDMLITSSWPATLAINAETQIDFVSDLITEIRTIRAEMNVPLSAKPDLVLRGLSDAQKAVVSDMEASIIRLARVTAIIASEGELPKQSARSTVAGVDIAMPLADILDFDAEKERLNKEIKAAEAEIMKLSRKLENEGFLAKAPEAVVEENRRRLAEDETRRDGLQAALKRLSEES